MRRDQKIATGLVALTLALSANTVFAEIKKTNPTLTRNIPILPLSAEDYVQTKGKKIKDYSILEVPVFKCKPKVAFTGSIKDITPYQLPPTSEVILYKHLGVSGYCAGAVLATKK